MDGGGNKDKDGWRTKGKGQDCQQQQSIQQSTVMVATMQDEGAVAEEADDDEITRKRTRK